MNPLSIHLKPLFGNHTCVLPIRRAFAQISILLCAMVLFGNRGWAQNQDADVRFDTVKDAATTVPVASQCLVESTQIYTISSQVDAALIWLPLAGEAVADGDRIAEQDTWFLRNQQQQIELAKSRLAEQHAHNERQIARLSALQPEGHVAEHELDDLEHQRRVLTNDIAQQRARSDQLGEQIRRSLHRAQFDGIVTQRFAEPGQYLTVGDPILELISDRSKEIRCELAADHVAAVAPGLILNADINGQTAPLSVSRVRKWSSSGSQSFSVYLSQAPRPQNKAARQPNTTSLLDPLVIGSSVSIQVDLPATVGLRISHDALLLDNNANADPRLRHYVIAQSAGSDELRKVTVQVLTSTPDYLIVNADGAIASGDRVAVRGARALIKRIQVAGATK